MKKTKSMAQLLGNREDYYLLEPWQFQFPLPHANLGNCFGLFHWRQSKQNPNGCHFGIDIGDINNYGQSVYSAGKGTVILAGLNGAYGNCVIIRHGNNAGFILETVYGHLKRINVKRGQEIPKGFTIGFVGGRPGDYGAGHSTSPHLHFEMVIHNIKFYKNIFGKLIARIGPPVAVDPAPFFKETENCMQWR